MNMFNIHSITEIRVRFSEFLHFLWRFKLRFIFAKKSGGGHFFLRPQYLTHNVVKLPQMMQFYHLTLSQLRILPMKKVLAINCLFREKCNMLNKIYVSKYRYLFSKEAKRTRKESMKSPTSKTLHFRFLTSLTLKTSWSIIYEIFLKN